MSATIIPDQLSPADIDAMRAFLRFHEPRRAAIFAATRAAVERSPRWASILARIPAELSPLQEEQSRTLQTQAVFDGRWEPYLARLQELGKQYARDGVSYAAWFDQIRLYLDAVGEQLSESLKENPELNIAAVLSLSRGRNCLVDIAVEQIGEGYLTARQQLVASSEVLHRSMFEHSPLPMWTFDPETLRFLTVNEAAVHHYGYTRDDFAAMTIADIRPDEDKAALTVDVEEAAGSGQRQTRRHRKKDGTNIIVEICVSDFVIDGDRVRLVLVNDVTERVQAEASLREIQEQLRRAQKMEAIGRLAGGVAHDFNNMLTVIQSCACMLEDRIDLADERRQDAVEIRRATERASNITRQLLSLSRQGVVAPRPIDLADLIGNFLPILRRLVGKTVDITTFGEAVPRVFGDPGQIEQVLMNLAVNARDAMPDGGRLILELRNVDLDEETAKDSHVGPGKYVELAVSDTGVGMDRETQRRIFDPFFTTKEEGKGTGLGLSIVYGIVNQAGGRVLVYTEPGHGTTFRVQLPVRQDDFTMVEPTPGVVPLTLPPLRVLIVEDDSHVRTIAVRILRDAGCTAIEAATAEEARKVCVRDDGPIDIVLLDVTLPDGRGDLLIPELRELRPALTFVLMSGYSARTLRAGAPPENLLPKPFTPSELRAAVAHASRAMQAASASVEHAEIIHQRRALVADDDHAMRRVVVRLLRKAEFDVVDVDSGSKAITALESSPFDVVISDVQMPQGGGLDLLRAVRRVDLDVPVILMTGQPSVDAAATAVEYGAFRYLTKPLDNTAFTNVVKQAARAHALARLRREANRVTGAHASVTDRAGLEVRFEQALDRMWMAFQPIVRASSGTLFGVEALMRSSEPSIANPPALLDAATQLGRLPLLGRKVRVLASKALAARSDDIALFVNLHPDDLHDVDLVDNASPLTQIAPRVILEVTERTSLDTTAKLRERIARVRQLGFRLAVDDIGAGYSGLTSFTELSPEVVKIDMSLVREVHRSVLKQRTIRALCRLCHEVGTLVVGEGVETCEERDALVDLGCDLLQGYFLGRPQQDLP